MNSVDADLEAVRERLREAAKGPSGSALPLLEDLASRPGKLLRPRLLCLFARACARAGQKEGRSPPDGRPEAVLDAAAAVELLHLATLVHDDIIDESPLRRGKPSLFALRGPRLAVLAGDWLLARALSLGWKAAMAIEGETAEGGRPRPSWAFHAPALGRMVEAEMSQADGRFSIPEGRRGYFRRIRAKTALLFELSCRLGAYSVGSDPACERAAARFGQAYGMAFQITDDILDFESSTSTLGKPVGSDLASGIFTLPVIEALLRSDDGRLRSLLSRPPYRGRRLAAIRRAVQEFGGMEAARLVVRLWMERGLRALEAVPPSSARDELAALCRGLIDRRT